MEDIYGALWLIWKGILFVALLSTADCWVVSLASKVSGYHLRAQHQHRTTHLYLMNTLQWFASKF